MALEIARIEVLPGSEVKFEWGFAKAKPLFLESEGCRSVDLLRSYEESTRYWLLVDWADVGAHEAFRASPRFQEWRSLVGEYFAGTPTIEHGLTVDFTPQEFTQQGNPPTAAAA